MRGGNILSGTEDLVQLVQCVLERLVVHLNAPVHGILQLLHRRGNSSGYAAVSVERDDKRLRRRLCKSPAAVPQSGSTKEVTIFCRTRA